MKKNNSEAVLIAKYIYEFLYDYAPSFLTNSSHTLKSYSDTLTVYVSFLESEGITADRFGRKVFEKSYIEKWIKWLIANRSCCADTCNVRLGALRVFLQFLGEKDISLMYLYQEAKTIKRQKCVKKKVNGLTRDAVSAIFNEIDTSTKTGRRDLVLLSLMYGTAARIGEVLSIKIEHLHLNSAKPYVTLYGKGGKTRTAFLLPRVTENIKAYIKEFHGDNPTADDYLFFSRVGGNKSALTEPAIDKRIKKYAGSAHQKCIDVPVNTHAHQFRHAKASHWLEDGINVVQVSFLLGHENLETTMKYLDITSSEKVQALATLKYETDLPVSKKWRKVDGSLSDFLQIKRQ